ncbi:hypothetical protein [Streptomyces sp. NPDC059010]|uniref:hypothetical protein n=1 Tax=Streptomyces sp. NPDC059010 TaxID=3346695 RepID=UPI0036A756F9
MPAFDAVAQSVTDSLKPHGPVADRARGDSDIDGSAIYECLGQGGRLGWAQGALALQEIGDVFQSPLQAALAVAAALHREDRFADHRAVEPDWQSLDQRDGRLQRVTPVVGRVVAAAWSALAVAAGEVLDAADGTGVGVVKSAALAAGADPQPVAQTG